MRILAVATLALMGVASFCFAQERSASADQRVGPPASSSQSPADVQKRVRELIYVLRYHRVSVRTEEWAGAIRELVQIGKPAVPEVAAELDRTDRTAALRGLAFVLRGIGDPRAVPALIRALDKRDLEVGSDFGCYVLDRELMLFLQQHQDFPQRDEHYFSYGRPINEISTALVKLTGRQEPVGLRDSLRKQDWKEWWAQHGSKFAPEKDRLPAPSAGHGRDLVEEAGIARFGPLFPTGKEINLGPVHEVELQFDGYLNARSYIDFDTGRLYQFHEGISADEAKSQDFSAVMGRWLRRTGVDAHCNASVTGNDLQLWLIDNSRWDTLPGEVHGGGPLNLGREATAWLEPFGKTNIDFRENELGTFLFITREGGRGVIQSLPRKDDETYSRKIRYRLWGKKGDLARAVPVQPARRDESQWELERTGILRAPGRDQAFLMSLETGERRNPPDTLVPAQLPRFFSFAGDKDLAAWCRAHGANLGTIAASQATNARAKSVASTALTLVGLDMTVLPVLPNSYEDMTLAELKTLILRWPAIGDQGWMIFTPEPRRDTYVVVTKSATLGVLQIKAIREQGGGIAFRYRLAKDRAGQH